ncbi:MAG TPA: DUF6221 family protein [Actinocrinis sp.]|uniref:DUF6221 family protein n=1 Tax=Actinocrinis sp. TaxID=1920516 RepID=UPI002DDD44D2|nr:DUF6221 family protein [Actinocrinis sp.]HEV2343680.1 DUF6221 family protein [Actinocrinis sp.]
MADYLGIVEFLTVQYDEAQRRAELAQQVIAGTWDCWEVVAQQLHACCDTVPRIGRVGQLLQHDADPAFVLADIAAKRAIVHLHRECGDTGYCDDGGHGYDWKGATGRCATLCYLAAPYADQPGYNPDWRDDD